LILIFAVRVSIPGTLKYLVITTFHIIKRHSATAVREDTIDFDFDNVVTLTSTERWNQSTSDKYATLEENVNLVRQAGYNPTDIVMGANAKKLLLSDADFLDKYFDKTSAIFGMLIRN
jgi:hypothetical protein